MNNTKLDGWKFISVDGINTRYRDEGAGDAIVLIHGGDFGGGGGDTWPDELIAPLVDEGHRVIVIDRLGMGRTDNPRSDDEYRMSVVIAHAIALLRLLGVDGATLAGQSRGAFVASRIAKQAPELCRRLVIVNSATVSPWLPAESVPSTLTYRAYIETFTGDTRQDAALMSVTTEHITDEWVRSRAETAALPKSLEAKAAMKRAHTELFAEFEVLKADLMKWFIGGGHTKPTLITWGVGDITTRSKDALEIFDILQPHVDDLRLHMINRSGHWPHREYPEEVAAEINSFIARHESAR